jgi:indolepyruvate decarboxylase
LGDVSPRPLRDTVEQSDCVLLVGELISDVGLGVSPHRLSSDNLVIAVGRDVYIRHHRFHDVPLDRLIERMLSARDLPSRPPVQPFVSSQVSPEVLEPMDDNEPIRMRHAIAVLNEFLGAHQDLTVVADTGDCLFASVDIQVSALVAPAYYATMGFAVPAALGVQIASGRRPLVLVGDGAFQMTGPEISHAAEYRCNPIVVLFNNGRWEMLQAFFPDAGYNATVTWPFARLAELWGGRGTEAPTPGRFREALARALGESTFTLIEVPLERGDISPILRGFVEAFRKKVY